jgi:hypothetical protein
MLVLGQGCDGRVAAGWIVGMVRMGWMVGMGLAGWDGMDKIMITITRVDVLLPGNGFCNPFQLVLINQIHSTHHHH